MCKSTFCFRTGRGPGLPPWSVAVVFICGFLRGAFSSETAPAADLDPSVRLMRAVVERYGDDQRALERWYNIDIAEARWQRLKTFLEEQQRSLGNLDFDALKPAGRIDYLLLRNKLRFQLQQLQYDREQFDQVSSLVPFGSAIIDLEMARRRMEPANAVEGAEILADIAQQAARAQKELSAKLKSAPEPADLPGEVIASRAARVVDDLRNTLKRWHDFYAGYDPEFTWWMRHPFPRAERELKDYASFLRKRLAGFPDEGEEPVIGDPIGREALIDALAAEMIPYSPEELIEIGEREFAWCEREMKRAADDLGLDGDWQRALDHVSRQHLKPGGQPELIKKLAHEAVEFLRKRDLVTIPELCLETWRMEMMSPERQRVNPYFTGGEVISVSYPTETMSHEDKLMSMRGNNPSFSRATVFHELIPGHHLQGFMAQRYNAHRRAFRTPFLVEGWALHWEMLLWDMSFPRHAEDRVGMLFWRSHRCARIIFSLKFHLGEMSAAEAIDFLVERVGHERRNATAEVRRSVAGSYSPLYQAAYMLGGLQLRALRKELVEAGKMSDREFHDAVLRENAIPIEMIRASLTRQNLRPDFKSNWRFYDPGQSGTADPDDPKSNAKSPREQ